MRSSDCVICTGWRRPIECLKLQVIFCERATNYRALLRKIILKDKASYASSPLCSDKWLTHTSDMTHDICDTLHPCVSHDSFTCVTAIRDSFTCVTADLSPYWRYDSFMCERQDLHKCVTRRIHNCDVSHSFVCIYLCNSDSFTIATMWRRSLS